MTLQPRLSSFESFQNRWFISGDLVAITGLRIGAGRSQDAATTDHPVVRDALGRPFVPGSSLKGVIRSGLERILGGLENPNFSACNPFDESRPRASDDDSGLKTYHVCGSDISIPHDPSNPSRNAENLLETVLDKSCTICGLFGSQHLAGRVFVHDLPAAGQVRVRTEVRDGVGIHRDLGTAVPKLKYDMEVVPPGTRFRLELVLENVSDIQLALVLQSLSFLDKGEILLGGRTASGLGRIGLEDLLLEQTSAQGLLAGIPREKRSYFDQLTESSRLLAKVAIGDSTTTTASQED